MPSRSHSRRQTLRLGSSLTLVLAGGRLRTANAEGQILPEGDAYAPWGLWNDPSLRGAPLALVAAAEQERRMIEDSWLGTLQDCLMPNEGQGARYHSADIFRHVLRLNPAKEYEPGQRLKRNMIKLGFRHSTELRINRIKRNGYYWPADENDSPSAEPRPGTKLIESPWSVTGEHTGDGSRGGNGSGDDDTPF